MHQRKHPRACAVSRIYRDDRILVRVHREAACFFDVDTGTLYAHLVLSAYRQRRINPADVSDYLNVRLKHVPAIGILVAQRSAP